MIRKCFFLTALCFLILLCNVASASVSEITFCGIPWLSNKDIVFQSIGIQDLITMDRNADNGSPIYIYGGKTNAYIAGEYTKTKRYNCLAYATAPYGSYTFILDDHFTANGLMLYFLPTVENGAIIEDPYQALFVKAMLQIQSDDYSDTYDELIKTYTLLYGSPDRTVEVYSQGEKRNAYSVWFGNNGTLFQIILDTPRDDYNNLIMEYQKYEIEDLVMCSAITDESDKNMSESRNIKCGDYIYNILGDGTAEIIQYTGEEKTLVVPDALDGIPVTKIGYEAFKFCYSLTSVTIPDSVISIGEKAFYGCWGLTSVTISNSVAIIGDYAFFDCQYMNTAIIPDTVTSIGENAFSIIGFVGLTAVVIPNSKITIIVGPDSYAKQYCTDNNLRYSVRTSD